jgi:hypothetical protein
MSNFVVTYDVRATNHDYTRLYDLLNLWGAAHLQGSVWLLDRNDTSANIRDAMMAHMHPNDTACVIQLPDRNAQWATINARDDGNNWLTAKFP